MHPCPGCLRVTSRPGRCVAEDRLIVVVLTNFDAPIFELGRPLVTAARSD